MAIRPLQRVIQGPRGVVSSLPYLAPRRQFDPWACQSTGVHVKRRRRFCRQMHFYGTFNMHIPRITTSVKFSSSNGHPTRLDVANASALRL